MICDSKWLGSDLRRALDRPAKQHGRGKAAKARGASLKPGAVLIREWEAATHRVEVVEDGFVWNGQTHRSLSRIARLITGTNWNGPAFFGLRQKAFNTTTSMGRLTLNVLLSFAQFEREVTGERIRDKIAASKAKGLWVGAMCRWAMRQMAEP